MRSNLLDALAGKRIVLTRPRGNSGDFEEIVRRHGGLPVVAPAIRISDPGSFAELDEALRAINTFDIVMFTSVNAVNAIVRRARELGINLDGLSVRVGAVGKITREAAAAMFHLPNVVAPGGTADSLLSAFGDISRRRIFFPRGNLSDPALVKRMTVAGAFVAAPVVYLTEPDSSIALLADDWRAGSLDAVLFSSPSAVWAVAAALENHETPTHKTPAIFCIGPTTASAALAAKMEVADIAESGTQLDLLNVTARWFDRQRENYD